MVSTQRICKDCRAEAEAAGSVLPTRPAPHPGPRCATHWREKRRQRKGAAHSAWVARTYSLEEHDYGRLYEAQGGVCAICQRANGATRRLSVDHDHKCCNASVSCGYCVRGLLCRPCNDLLGHCRDSWEMLARAIRYLTNPPAKDALRKRRS